MSKLQTIIEYAIERGWGYLGKPENGWGVDVGQWNTDDNTEHLLIVRATGKGDFAHDDYIHVNQIIFNHDFIATMNELKMTGKC